MAETERGQPPEDGGGALRMRLAELCANISLELLPEEVIEEQVDLDAIPLGTRVFLTRLARSDFSRTVAAARRLHERGLVPVPHLTARTVESAAALDAHLAGLREAGIDDVLLIAGSNAPPLGPFENTIEILETGAFERAGIRRLGVAGHPEGHPQASSEALHRALAVKNAFARDTGIRVYIVTQFFFDAGPVIAWEKEIRNRGNALPVHPGLHGVTSVARLVKYGLACGIGASLNVLRRRSSALLGLVGAQSPDRLAVDIARASLEDPSSLFSSFHVFPLGGFDATMRWIRAMREERFELRSDGMLDVEA